MSKKKSDEIQAPPPSTEDVPDIQELGLDRKTTEELSNLVIQHGELGFEKRRLEKERNKLTPKIKKILGDYGIGKFFCGEYRTSYYTVPRTSLSEELLLSHGVKPSVIAACRITKDVYTLKISPRSEPESEDW